MLKHAHSVAKTAYSAIVKYNYHRGNSDRVPLDSTRLGLIKLCTEPRCDEYFMVSAMTAFVVYVPTRKQTNPWPTFDE